jgi:hypothetical protein
MRDKPIIAFLESEYGQLRICDRVSLDAACIILNQLKLTHSEFRIGGEGR